jgi:hypothetical protein
MGYIMAALADIVGTVNRVAEIGHFPELGCRLNAAKPA